MKKQILIEIIIWTVILAVTFTIGIFSYSKIFVEPNIYTIEFKDIDGITQGSPVRFMGINVGHVRNLSSDSKSVYVQIIITKKDIKIPNGTIARVEFYGLGGSKSIELMPPDGSCNVGIVSEQSLRLHDVAKKARSIVDILEIVASYIKGLNSAAIKNVLETTSEFKDENIKNKTKEITKIEEEIAQKQKALKQKEEIFIEKINAAERTVNKLNNFIKN